MNGVVQRLVMINCCCGKRRITHFGNGEDKVDKVCLRERLNVRLTVTFIVVCSGVYDRMDNIVTDF